MGEKTKPVNERVRALEVEITNYKDTRIQCFNRFDVLETGLEEVKILIAGKVAKNGAERESISDKIDALFKKMDMLFMKIDEVNSVPGSLKANWLVTGLILAAMLGLIVVTVR